MDNPLSPTKRETLIYLAEQRVIDAAMSVNKCPCSESIRYLGMRLKELEQANRGE